MNMHFTLIVLCLSFVVYSLSVRGIAENSSMYGNRLGLLTRERILNFLFPSNFRKELNLSTVYFLSTLTYTGIVFFLHQHYEQGLHFYVYALLFVVLVSSAVTDLYTQMISDEILNLGYSLIPFSVLFGVEHFIQQLIFVAIAFAVMWILNWLGMLGGGDVQLLVIIGFFLTREQFLTSFLSSALAGVVFAALVWMVTRSLGRFAYLPSILAGVAVTLLFDLNLFGYYFN